MSNIHLLPLSSLILLSATQLTLAQTQITIGSSKDNTLYYRDEREELH